MQGLEVVTYQAAKKNGGGYSGDTQDIVNRLDKLENQQSNIYNEFFCDFTDSKYIDVYKTTVLYTNNGIIPRQFKESVLVDFSKNDDYVDYDESQNMAWFRNSSMQFDKTITTGAELYLFPIRVNNAAGFKLDSSYFLPTNVSGAFEKELDTGNRWTAHEVDKFGRLWVFSKKGYTNLVTDKIKLTIYNKDMTVYESREIDNFLFTENNFLLLCESTTITFNEENVCFIGVSARLLSSSHIYSIFACYDYNSNRGTIISRYRANWGPNIIVPRGNIYVNSNIIFFSNVSPSGGAIFLFVHDTIINFKSFDEMPIIYTNGASYGLASPELHQFKSNIFKVDNKFYYLAKKYTTDYYAANGIPLSSSEIHEFTINDDETKASLKVLPIVGDITDLIMSCSITGSNLFFYNGYMYSFYSRQDKTLNVKKYKYIISNINFTATKIIEKNYTLSTSTGLINTSISKSIVVIDNGLIHYFYDIKKSDVDTKRCTKYMAFDFELDIAVAETILYETTSSNLYFKALKFNDKLYVVEDYNRSNNYISDDTNNICKLIRIDKVTSSLQYYYYDDVRRSWTNINAGDEVVFNYEVPVNEITIKAILESQTYNSSPVIKNINLQSWNNNKEGSRQSEFHSTRIDTVKNDGKGVLVADYEDNDGTIDWHISFDGGNSYSQINLNEEFVYTHISAPDFRVKAVLSVTDNAKTLPIVHSYTLKTSHVVLHSDLEEIQINLMKTNFKIDTYTNASKNGLLKMTIDTLSDDQFIDSANSDYTYFPTHGYASGNYIQTKPEVVDSKVTTILLTTDETSQDGNVNSRIIYYVSVDGGKAFTEITPNVKMQIKNVNAGVSTIVFKAVFYEGAKLSAWGWAWN